MFNPLTKADDLKGFLEDCFDDFVATVKELTKQGTVPQIMGVLAVCITYAGAALVIWGAFSVLIGGLVLLLWNAALPELGVPEISYWQACGITYLSAILFRGNSITVNLRRE